MGILKKPEWWKKKYHQNVSGKGTTLANILAEIFPEVLKRASSDVAEANFQARILEAIKAKRRQLALRGVDPSLAVQIIKQVVPTIYDTAVSVKGVKYDNFVDKWYPILRDLKAQVDAMPKRTLQEAIAKAAKMITLLAQNKGKWRTPR